MPINGILGHKPQHNDDRNALLEAPFDFWVMTSFFLYFCTNGSFYINRGLNLRLHFFEFLIILG